MGFMKPWIVAFLFAFSLLGLFLYKPMYSYFTEIFQAYEQLGTYRFWRIVNLFPLFLVLDMLYVILRGDRVVRLLVFRPRLLLFVGLLLFMAAVRRRQRTVPGEKRPVQHVSAGGYSGQDLNIKSKYSSWNSRYLRLPRGIWAFWISTLSGLMICTWARFTR